MENNDRISLTAEVNASGTKAQFYGDRVAMADFLSAVAQLQKEQGAVEEAVANAKSGERITLAKFRLQFDLSQGQNRLQFCLAVICAVVLVVAILSMGGQKNGQGNGQNNSYGYDAQRISAV